MLSDPTLRKGIIAGVIASLLFVIFVQPIAQIVLTIAKALSAGLYTKYSDHIYSNAALGQRDWVTVLIFVGFGSALVGSLFAFLITRVLRKQPAAEEVRRQKTGAKRISGVISLVGLFLIILHFITVVLTDLEYNTSFQQRLTIVAPYLSEDQEEELRAMWASMRNRRDYDLVNGRLEELARRQGIRLPEPLLQPIP